MEGYACTVYSAGGQARMTFRVQSPDERIPCPLPRGLYLFDGRNAGQRITLKFISR
jgi:hypothetical protein